MTIIAKDTDWEMAAVYFLEQEKIVNTCNYPKSISVIIRWRGNIYIGSIQLIEPEFSKEIVLLSKSSYIIPDKLVNAIKRIDKGRLEFDADENLDLSGRQHVLRLFENTLIHLTPQQTKYMIEHPLNICEI